MPAEELPLDMRIDLEIRDVLIRHKTTAWDLMENDILDGIKRHKWCCSRENRQDIGETGALKDWLYMMQTRCLRPEPSEAESAAENAFMRLLRYYGISALKVMADRADDLNKHLWYASEWAGRDIGRSAALDDWIKKYTWYPANRELLEIEYAYKRGEFRQEELDLYKFVSSHPNEIEEYRKSFQKRIRPAGEIGMLDAIRLLFFKKQSANPARDILIQRDMIQREIDAQHANDEDTRTRIVLDYRRNRAADWRNKRVMIIEYILTVQAEKFLAILQKAPERQLEYAQAG